MGKNTILMSFILAIVILLTSVAAFLMGQNGVGGLCLTLFWLVFGLFASSHPKIQGSFYTFFIFACISIGMFFPNWFIELNWNCPALGIQLSHFKLTATFVPLLQLVMFGMGTQLTLGDFRAIIVQPKGVLVGLLAQFSIMPFLGLALACLCGCFPGLGFTPEILAGIILVGCSPSGMASNVIAFIAKANIALSVTLTSCATLLAPLLTPLLMKCLASQYVEINFLKMMSDILALIIFPILGGLLFRQVLMHGLNLRRILPHALVYTAIIFGIHALLANAGLYANAEVPMVEGMRLGFHVFLIFILSSLIVSLLLRRFLTEHPTFFQSFIKFVSSFAIAVIVLFSVAVGRDDFIKVGPVLALVCLIHNLFGYFLGYQLARLVGMNEQDRRTIAIEVGMQNGGLGSTIAKGMGKIATVGLAPATFGTLMNVTGSILASFWQRRPVDSEDSTDES